MVFDMNFNEYKGSPHDSPQGGRYLPNGGLDPEGQTVTMEEQGVYQDGRTFSDNQTGTVFIRISIPELKIQKCLQFELDETVWRAKQRVLVTFAKDLKDSINYGLYCPPMNGRAGKFLDEERLLREYPLQGPIGFLEFKYKKRVYKMMHVNPRKLKQLHVKGNLRHFIDYVRSGNIEKVTKLTNKGLDPNFHDSSSGETPLTMAVSTVKIKCREMILCLAGGGAHLDFRNKRGIAALHKAVVVGNLEAVKTLLDLGVSPNLRDSHALTPLYFSVANSCNPACTEMLLQERAFIGSVDDQGWAEIHHACQQGLVQHLEHLLFYGADMDIQNAAGNTPLHICALNNQESCLRVLLFRGANKEVLNYSNQTPYEVALIAGHDIMADIIDEHSTDAVVQYRDVPKYSNRRRDSVASMALFAMYRTRSDPRINASFMDGPGGMVSPSSSSHSFSHIHNSYTGSMSGSRGSISGSRGTDSPCSMSISSNSSGPVVGVTDHGLWEGRVNGNEGWFPSNHVQEVKLRRKAGSLGDIIKGTRDFRDVNRNTLATIQHNYSEYAPRSVVLQKGPEGYGFVLRGAKSQTNAAGELDFRPSAEFPALQYLDSVDPGSRSDRAGLKTGDFILEINGENVVRASHDRVVQLIRQSGDTLALKVVTVKPMDKPQHWLQHHDGTMTLPNRNSKKPAPQPPQRDPQTSLSYSKARGKSITEGMAEIDHLDMVLAGYDQQPDQISISSEHKTASIRSKHSAKRVSCIELDKIENPDSNASVTSSKGKAPAPQPKDYMSPSEIRIKKYHKGKQNGLERSSSTPDLLDGNRKSEPVYATPIPPGDGRRSSSGAINNVYATPGERPKGPPPPPPAGSSTPTPKRPAPAPPKGAEVVQTSKTEVVTINTDKRISTYSNANDGKVIDRRKSEYESSFRPGISASLTDEPKISTPSLQQAKLSNRTHNRNSSQISVQSSDSTGSKNSEDKPSVSFAEDKVMVNAESFLQRHPNAQLLVTAEVHKKSPERKPSEPEPDYDADSDDNKENSASSNSVTVISVGGASNNNAKKFTVKSDIPTVSPEEKMVIPPPPSEPAPEPPKPAEKVSSGATTPSEHSRQSSISDNKEQSNAPPAPPPPPVAPPPPPIQAPDREKTPPPVSENKPKKPLGGLPTTDILAAVEKRKTRLENDGPKISSGPNKEVKPRNSTDLRNKLIENTQAAILEAVAKRRAKLEQTTETEVADQIESKLQKTKKLQTSKMYFSSDSIQKMDKKENSTKKEEDKPETKSTAIFSSDLIAKKNPPNPSTKRAPSPKNKPPSPVPSQKIKPPVPAPTKETNSQGIKVSVKEKSPIYVSPVKNVSTTSSKSESKQMKEKTDTSTSEKKEDVKVNGDLNGEDFVAMAEKARQDWIKKRSSSSLLLKNKPDVKVKSGEKSKTQAPASPKKSSNAIPGPPKTNGIIVESASAKVNDKSYTKKASTSASPSKTTSVSKIDSGEIIPLKSARDTVMIAKSTSIRSRIANFEQGAKQEGKSSNPTSPRSKIPVHGVTIDSTTTESHKRGALPPPPGFGDAVHLEIIPPPTGFSVTDGLESPSYSAFNHDDSSSVSTLSTLSDDALDGRPKHGYEDLIAPPPPGFDDNVRSDSVLPSVIPPPPDFGGTETKSKVLKLNSLGNKPFESKPVESWQCLDVLDWLDSLNMTQYKTSFQQRCVDGKKLVGLTRNDYIQLGVTQVGHRMNLERSIKKVSAKKFSS